MIIRRVRPEEWEAVGDLRVAAYESDGMLKAGPDYAEVLRRLGADGGEVLVAEDADGALLGTVMLQDYRPSSDVARAPEEAEVRALAVSPAARGRGVGRALVEAVVERSEAQGAHRVVLSTQPTMAAAQRIYERRGFRRLPDRDWDPFPGLTLLAYGLELG
ncbi:GNAT family N-acetyltransferase [Nocardiopsis sp. RSe5-2]|uniref:GNAT family N-acetyltransferase n=1 Tax=Nocardiopsis endophytica TaxID=3018445 RepID=A0ABT4U8Y0_9ACTN|nr:GNAT family N-acetyltransferase [Nocardiopsis endophytica]MDA2812870.1 GNAT family N-acetyltransferase [Nocardiopsis endophytica]